MTGLSQQRQVLPGGDVCGHGAAGWVPPADASDSPPPDRRRSTGPPRRRWVAVSTAVGVARRYLPVAADLAASGAAAWVLLPWLNPTISDTHRWLAVLAGSLAGTAFAVLALAARSRTPTASRWLGRAGRMLPVIGIVVLVLAYSGGCHLALAQQPTAPASTCPRTSSANDTATIDCRVWTARTTSGRYA